MPLFFILSGMLYKPEMTMVLIKKRSTSLLIPYMAFLLLLNIKPIVATIIHPSFQALPFFCGLIYGGFVLKGWFGVFWFISCLFITQISYNTLLKYGGGGTYNPLSRQMVFIILICATLTLQKTPVRLPLAAEVVPIALVFFWTGHLASTQNLLKSKLMQILSTLGTSSCLLIFCSGYATLIAFDMKSSLFGLPIVSLIFAISLVLIVLKVVIFISKYRLIGKMMASLGSASLIIMYLSQPINITLRSRDWPDFFILILSVALPYLIFHFINLHWMPRFVLLGIKK